MSHKTKYDNINKLINIYNNNSSVKNKIELNKNNLKNEN